MKPSLNKIKSFEPGSSTNWKVSISGGAVDTSKMNIAGGTLPVRDINYTQLNVGGTSITVGPNIPIEFITSVEVKPDKITLTIFDDHDNVISNCWNEWATKGVAGNLAPDKKDYAVLTVMKYNKTGKLIKTESFYVFPVGELPWAGDQEFSAVTYSVSLSVHSIHSVR